jgi:cyclic pyranopterin phosphate synthase
MNPLIDLHGRQIRYVRISITDRCNLRCRYCMPVGGVDWVPHEQVLSYEEMLRILRICIARGVEKVRITGGEPLLRRDIVGFISQLNSTGG